MAKGPVGNAPRDLKDTFVGEPPDRIRAPEPPKKSRGPRKVTGNTFHAKVEGSSSHSRADRAGHFRSGGYVSPRGGPAKAGSF